MKGNYVVRISAIMMAVAVVGACSKAWGGPVDRGAIIEEPAWVLHVDFDGFRNTGIGKQIMVILEKPDQDSRFLVYKTFLTFDPRKALHGLTLYGSSASPEDAVALIYADVDAERLSNLAQMAEDHHTVEHGKYSIHNWIDGSRREKSGGQPRTYAAIHKAKVVIFGQKERTVAGALDLLDGSQPSYKSKEAFPEFGKPAEAVFAQGLAAKFDSLDNSPQAAVLKSARKGWLEFKGAEDKITGSLALEAANDETASHIADALRGLVSLLALQKEKPEAVRLARTLSAQADGRQATLKFSITGAELFELAKVKP